MVDEGPRGWAARLHAAVLDASSTGPGTHLLDLGCGAGHLARAAAERGARVTGIDLDPAAIRAAAAAVPEGSFAVRDALDPPPGRFDVAVAVQLLMHVPDPVAVLAAAGRRAPVVVATVWGREQECDVRAFGEALAPWVGRRPAAAAVTDPRRLQGLAGRAGLVVERLEEVVCAFDYAGDDALVDPLLASGLGRAAAARAGPEAVRAAVLRRCAPYRTPFGSYRLRNLFRVLVARPGG
ncbi:class I SAM-dependent methyltransferase [Geodermatophilus sp. SYSU D00815]